MSDKWKEVDFNADSSFTIIIVPSALKRMGILPLVWGEKIKSKKKFEYRELRRKKKVIIEFREIK